jgi:hypothetical protein
MLAAGVAALAVWPSSVLALDNGLVRVPWMGWSAWEVFRDTSPEQDPKRYVAIALIVLAPHTICTRPHAHVHAQARMSRMSVGSNPHTHDSVLSRSPLCLCSSCYAISGHAPARPAVLQSCSLCVCRETNSCSTSSPQEWWPRRLFPLTFSLLHLRHCHFACTATHHVYRINRPGTSATFH